MIRIEINGQPLHLKEERINIKHRNPMMFEDVLPRILSFPFKIDISDPHNAALLGYPAHWQRSSLKIEIACDIFLYGEQQQRQGTLRILRITNQGTHAEVSIVVGKLPADIGDTKLYDIPMDRLELTDERKEVWLHLVELGSWTAPANTTISLSINGTLYTAAKGGVAGAFINTANMANAINSTALDVFATVQTISGFHYLIITSVLSGSDAFFVFDDMLGIVPNSSPDNFYYWQVYDEDTWRQTHINATMAAIAAMSSFDPARPVSFPVCKNDTFDGDPNFVGYQNAELAQALTNPEARAYITPFPHLTYLLAQVFKYLGYTAIGDVMDSEEMQHQILYSNVAATKWDLRYGNVMTTLPPLYNTYDFNKEVNVHLSSIQVEKYCPEASIREFLTAIRAYFNLKYSYSEGDKTVNISFIDNGAANRMQAAKDYSHAVNLLNWEKIIPEYENSNIKEFAFTTDSNDEQQKTLQAHQQPLVLDAAAKKSIVPKVASINNFKPVFLNYPYLSQTGVLQFTGTRTMIKLLHFLGDVSFAPSGIAFASSFGGDITYQFVPTFSHAWGDTTEAPGLYTTFWRNHVLALRDGTLIKVAMRLQNYELAQIDNIPYHILNNTLAIWRECDIFVSTNGTEQSIVTYLIL